MAQLTRATVYTSSDHSNHFKVVFEHNDSNVLRLPPLLPELNRSPLGCGEMENLHHGCAADKLAVIL